MSKPEEFKEFMTTIDELSRTALVHGMQPHDEPRKHNFILSIDDGIKALVDYKAKLTGEPKDCIAPLACYGVSPSFYNQTIINPQDRQYNGEEPKTTFPDHLGLAFPTDLEGELHSDFQPDVDWQRYIYSLEPFIWIQEGNPKSTLFVPFGYNAEATSIDKMLDEGNHD